jgi:hypothetical protein
MNSFGRKRWIIDQSFQEGAMRLPRMTTRRWMIVVVVVGVLMGGIVVADRLRQRRADFNTLAQHHTYMKVYFRDWGQSASAVALWEASGRSDAHARLKDLKDRLSRLLAYHESMERKYQHAVRYPWLAIEADPPEP